MKVISFISLISILKPITNAVSTAALSSHPTAMKTLDPLSLDFSQIGQQSQAATQNFAQTEASSDGDWVEIDNIYNPAARYGHTADLYEPASSEMVESFKNMLRPANQPNGQTEKPEDSMFMIVFGGKNAQTEQMFNDIYFLGVPSFEWYLPKSDFYKAENAPQPRLGHMSAVYGDKLVVYGGHVRDGAISDELWTLNFQTMQWTNHGSQAHANVQPLAYTANTVMMDDMKLAIFGGLTYDINQMISGSGEKKFAVSKEIIFLNLKDLRWQKPEKVFANGNDDVPAARMGAQMVYNDNKLYVYGGAKPKLDEQDTPEVTFGDFFSFNTVQNYWTKETGYGVMNDEQGEILGKGIRLYNSETAVFMGGCDATSQTCYFDKGRQIQFSQPEVTFEKESNAFEGREGHSLIQLGDSIISFGGCQFGKKCFNQLLIQRPEILRGMTAYDCENGGNLVQKDFKGTTHSFCQCQDLEKEENIYYTGQQCQYTAEVIPSPIEVASPTVIEDDGLAQLHQLSVALASTGAQKVYENDGTCGENACSGAGICFKETCYCKRFFSGDDCEIDTAHPGLSTKTTLTFYSVSLILGLTMGAFLASIYNQNDRKLLK